MLYDQLRGHDTVLLVNIDWLQYYIHHGPYGTLLISSSIHHDITWSLLKIHAGHVCLYPCCTSKPYLHTYQYINGANLPGFQNIPTFHHSPGVFIIYIIITLVLTHVYGKPILSRVCISHFLNEGDPTAKPHTEKTHIVTFIQDWGAQSPMSFSVRVTEIAHTTFLGADGTPRTEPIQSICLLSSTLVFQTTLCHYLNVEVVCFACCLLLAHSYKCGAAFIPLQYPSDYASTFLISSSSSVF